MPLQDAIKLVAVGIAGYFAYRYFVPSAAASVNVPPAPAAGQTPPGASTNAAGPQLDTRSLVLSTAEKALNVTAPPLLNSDQWNYYYSQVRNVPGIDPLLLFPGVDRSKTYTVDEWWSASQARGLSGCGSCPGRRGLGGCSWGRA